MSKSIKRMSVLTTALAAALITLPLAAPSAAADPPRWAPAHGYRHMHGHGEYKYKHKVRRYRRHHGHHHTRHHRVRHHEVRRTVYVSRPAHHHYRQDRQGYGGDFSISPSVGGTIVGALIGGLGGSAIGSGSGRTVAIIGGVAAGAVIGNSVGRSMEAIDHAQVQHTLENGRTGSPLIWQNPDTGNRYEVTPTQTYQTANQRYCREYTSRATVGGNERQIYGTACRMPDGSWQLQPG